MTPIGHMRGQLIKARILRHIARHRGDSDMAEAEPEKPLPDVPLQVAKAGPDDVKALATRLQAKRRSLH